MSGSHRHRPRGWLRHYAGFLTPDAAAAMPVLLERDRSTAPTPVGGIGRRPRRAEIQAHPTADARAAGRPRSTAALAGRAGARAARARRGDRASDRRSTCDLDCGIALGATQFALPLHLGHECVADVLSVGERVSTVKPGDRVIVPFQINCGACAPCRAGRTGSCDARAPDLDVRDGPRRRAVGRRVRRPARRALRRRDARRAARGHRSRRRRERRGQRLRRLPPHRAAPARAAGGGSRRGGPDRRRDQTRERRSARALPCTPA